MPTRILREGILTSEPINQLSMQSELFYRRLMSVLDDHGRFFAHPSILRASCYPLQLDRVSEADVKQMLSECTSNAVLVIYNGGKHLFCPNFRQQTRAVSKFPEPPTELLSRCTANDKQMCTKAEAESYAKSEAEASPNGTNHPSVDDCISHFRKVGSDYTPLEVSAAFNSLQAGSQDGQWMWGKRAVGDWRSALESRIQDTRLRNPAKKKKSFIP